MNPSEIFRRVSWLLIIHFLLFLFGTFLFVLFFSLNINFFDEVYFYRGLILLVLSTTITFILAFVVYRFSANKLFVMQDVFLSALLVFSINLVFFTHVPVTADRSVSVYLLSMMSRRNLPITKETMKEVFTNEYLTKNDALGKRLEEQIVTGNIRKTEGGEYYLTMQGQNIVVFYNIIANFFDVDPKNIN